MPRFAKVMSELRSRKAEKTSSAEDVASSYISALNDIAPTPVKKYVTIAAPWVIACVGAAERAIPYLAAAYSAAMGYWVLLEPYKLDLCCRACSA